MLVRERLALDVAIFLAILAAANPLMTGMMLHELVGFALLVPAALHLVLNWDWVVRTATGFLGRVKAASRANLVIDACLFVSFVGVMLSGVLVIPGFAEGLGLEANGVWHLVHLVTSNLTVVFALAHLAMHAKWILDVLNRPAPARVAGAPRRTAPASAPIAPAPAPYASQPYRG